MIAGTQVAHLCPRISHLAHSAFPVFLALQREFTVAHGHEGAQLAKGVGVLGDVLVECDLVGECGLVLANAFQEGAGGDNYSGCRGRVLRDVLGILFDHRLLLARPCKCLPLTRRRPLDLTHLVDELPRVVGLDALVPGNLVLELFRRHLAVAELWCGVSDKKQLSVLWLGLYVTGHGMAM